MSQPKYLLYVNISPKGASDESWAKWFTSQHLPTLAKANVCTRVSVYKETTLAMLPHTEQSLRFLALYESDKAGLQNNDAYQPASPEEESDIRSYSIIQDYNPKNLDDGQTTIKQGFVDQELIDSRPIAKHLDDRNESTRRQRL